MFGALKAGHTGSLDPLATGVLPLCFGEATKVSQFLLESDKVYSATIRLGIATDTGDSEGKVIATTEVPEIDSLTLERTVQSFTGSIDQVASNYSALKQNGVPLYKLARAGKTIEPKSRTITIHYIKILSWVSPDIQIEVSCSKGTYIRSLAEDIGKQLGTGAHITALRRLKAGPFTLAQSHSIEALELMHKSEDGNKLHDLLISTDTAITHMPTLNLDDAQTLRLRQGQVVPLNPEMECGQYRVYFEGEFIGLAELKAGGNLAATRLMQYQTL